MGPSLSAEDRPRRVGLNAVFLDPGMSGIETYVRELVPALLSLRPDLELTLFLNPSGNELLAREPWSTRVELTIHPLLGRRRLKSLSELALLPRLARRASLDLLHSVAMTGPLRSPVPHVATIPDLIWLHHPGSIERLTGLSWRWLVPRLAKRADRILTYSEASRADLVETLGLPPEKIDAVPLGPGLEVDAEPTPESELRARLELGGGPLILCVAARKPHKNLVRLIEALPAILARFPDAILVVPGPANPHERVLAEEAARLGVAGAVRLPEWLADSDMEGLYRAAECFVLPSLIEGFGLPVLEAMRRGVPVACAGASALPELGGEAARYFDPRSTGQIGAAVCELLGDPELAAGLAAAGRERAAMFSWRATAEGTLRCYGRALATGAGDGRD